ERAPDRGRAPGGPARDRAPPSRSPGPARRRRRSRGGAPRTGRRRLRRVVRRRDLLRQRRFRRRVPRLAVGRRRRRTRAACARERRARGGAGVNRRYDAVAIGSGINSLVAAALLAKAGWSVCVLERNDWLRG